MRLRKAHRFGVVALYLLAHLGLANCSSGGGQQQQGDEVETGNVENSGEEPSDNATANTATDEMNGAEEATANEKGNQTGSDIQDIISEMNNGAKDQTAAAAAPAEEAKPAEAAPAAEPATETPPTETAAAAPAAEPAAAPAPSAGANLPEMGSKMPYIVQPGDTLATIAQKVYGDMNRWHDIKDLTKLANPNRIYPGDVVYYQLTKESQAFASNYEKQERSQVQVAAGDTLASIASKVLGSSKYWRMIWRQNDHVDNPDQLTVGTPIYYIGNSSKTGSTSLKSSNLAKSSVAKKGVNVAGSASNNVNAAKNVQSVNAFDLVSNVSVFAQLLTAGFAS